MTQIIAAIDWGDREHRRRRPHIGVINLSFGTDGTQSYQSDPLAYAVDRAWRAGIVVVVAAGNDGRATTG